uniref:Potassium channel subfamily K member 5-like n=1 Tax=Saccoglossus kowalevskii TaxID=10224 RepID=A0ABM0MXI1_SACKO
MASMSGNMSYCKMLRRCAVWQFLFLVYLLGGAYIFLVIESPHELQELNRMQEMKTNITDHMTGNTFSVPQNRTTRRTVVKKFLDKYEQMLYENFQQGIKTNITRWNYMSACVFSLTVITTIGYGHLVPATSEGRLVCVFYAFIGIPLVLIYLSSMGQMVAMPPRAVSRRLSKVYQSGRKSLRIRIHSISEFRKSHKVECNTAFTNSIPTISGNVVDDTEYPQPSLVRTSSTEGAATPGSTLMLVKTAHSTDLRGTYDELAFAFLNGNSAVYSH